jgi:hypothetical protein
VNLLPPLSFTASAPPEAEPAPAACEGLEDWQQAWRRLHELPEPAEPAEPLSLATPLPPLRPDVPLPPPSVVGAVGAVEATATVSRLQAAAPLAEAAAARPADGQVWQVELPGAVGPAWQLRIEQARPQAALQLELRVPLPLQLQARQQLGELDRRLREAGHDTLRARLSDRPGAPRRTGPLDETQELAP